MKVRMGVGTMGGTMGVGTSHFIFSIMPSWNKNYIVIPKTSTVYNTS